MEISGLPRGAVREWLATFAEQWHSHCLYVPTPSLCLSAWGMLTAHPLSYSECWCLFKRHLWFRLFFSDWKMKCMKEEVWLRCLWLPPSPCKVIALGMLRLLAFMGTQGHGWKFQQISKTRWQGCTPRPAARCFLHTSAWLRSKCWRNETLVPASTHGNLDLLLAPAQQSHAGLAVQIAPHLVDLNVAEQIKDKTFSLSLKRQDFAGLESHLSYFKTILECFIVFFKSNKQRWARLKNCGPRSAELGWGSIETYIPIFQFGTSCCSRQSPEAQQL